MTLLYRIMPMVEWRAAKAAGVFAGSAHDRRDGFIHLSSPEQVQETAAKHYAGQADLVLISLAGDKLDAARPGALKWELSRGGQHFPHLYADLPLDAVERVEALLLGSDGMHVFPPLQPAEPAPLGSRRAGSQRPTLRFAVRGTLAVYVSIDDVPSDAEWTAYCDALEELGRSSGVMRVYARTDGGPPSATQRKRVAELSRLFTLRSAVVTESSVARAITAALALFNPKIRAFSPTAAGEAYLYLVLTQEEEAWVNSMVTQFRAELRGASIAPAG
jgi:uncharacterized protein (DUF952 family)